MIHTPRWFRDEMIVGLVFGGLYLIGYGCYRLWVWIWPG